jgi:hypothetical protein
VVNNPHRRYSISDIQRSDQTAWLPPTGDSRSVVCLAFTEFWGKQSLCLGIGVTLEKPVGDEIEIESKFIVIFFKLVSDAAGFAVRTN